MTTFLRRLRYLLQQRKLEAEVAEEIEAHRLMAEERARANGVTLRDAGAASRRAMGNVMLAREEARAAWIAPWMDSAWQDVAYALRMFRRAPAFMSALVLVMAMGIGAATAVFTLVDGLMLKDLPVPAAERLVYFSSPSFSYPVFSEVRARGTRSSRASAPGASKTCTWRGASSWNRPQVLTASGEFYATLGVTAAIGRTFSDSDDRIGGGREGRVAVISDAAWRRRYGADPAVIGRTVRIGPDTYTIVGVTPAGFFGVAPGVAPDITIPLTTNADPSDLRSASSSWVHLIGRLRGGITLAEANAALGRFWPAALEATAPANARRRAAGAVPGQDHIARIGAHGLFPGAQPLRATVVVPVRAGRAVARRRLRQRGEPAAGARRRRAAGKSRCGWRLAPAAPG